MKSFILTTTIGLCLGLSVEAQTTFERRSVVEELTGTRCGWCPRGLAGMAKLRETFGDRFIGIAVHNFDTNDPMYYRPYAYTGLFDGHGAPTCTLDRQGFCDPLHGVSGDVCSDFQYVLDQPCYLGVTVSGEYSADSTVVNATATLQAGIDMSRLSVVFVLVADSVTSDNEAFRQYNGYATRQATDYPNDPELHPFCQGGEWGMSPFRWAFDDVCIGSSYNNQGQNQAEGVTTLTEGESATVNYRLQMPTKAILKRAFDKRKVSVVAMVLNEDGMVVNADKRLVGDHVQSIRTAHSRAEVENEAQSYDLLGRRIPLKKPTGTFKRGHNNGQMLIIL